MTVIGWLEQHFSRRPPQGDTTVPDDAAGLPDGSTVVIVGGGLAGSAYARQLLLLCNKANKRYRVYLINSTGCNYCGGLFTDLARMTLHTLYDQGIPADIALKEVGSCVYINSEAGVKVRLHEPMLATLRTSRFGITGFDDSLKERILEGLNDDIRHCLKIIEPTLVSSLTPPEETPKGRWRVTLSLRREDGEHETLDCDLLVLATGFRSLNKPMLSEFARVTGYIPPPVMDASVAEIDTSAAHYNNIGQNMFILDGIVPNAVVAFIPKGKDWLTMTALGKRLTGDDLETLFSHPAVKKYLGLDNPREHLRCRTMCPAAVYTGAARNFYGDGWVMLGDLTGYGRVLKDGYFAAFLGSYLAARTTIYSGTSKEAWQRQYHRPLRVFEADNRTGMLLYNLNLRLNQKPWFNRLYMAAAQSEGSGDNPGGPIHAGIRGLASGKIPYALSGVFFALGLVRYILRHPLKTLRLIRRQES